MCICTAYPTDFSGLVTSPCHGLTDTGAQDGVVGLFDSQRWVICLALVHGLQPSFLPLPEHAEAGGIGGQAKVLAVCMMPTGLAGVNGVSRWVILDEPDSKQNIPPLIPITLLKELDAVIEPRERRLTLRFSGSVTKLEELESGHQTMLLMDFEADNGWSLPEEIESDYFTPSGINPFVFNPSDGPASQTHECKPDYIVK